MNSGSHISLRSRHSPRTGRRHVPLLFLCAVTAVLVAGACSRHAACRRRPRQPRAAVGRGATAHELLEGTLWVQTSAEYAALATAAYRHGQLALDDALADKTWTAATEQNGAFAPLPPAVILDLDETVLDNSRMQAQLVIDRTVYSRERWKAWVDRRRRRWWRAKAFLDTPRRAASRSSSSPPPWPGAGRT